MLVYDTVEALSRLVFSSEGVVVGVVIRSDSAYDCVAYLLVKTRLSESKQNEKSNPVTMLDSGPCDRLVLSVKFLLQTRTI